MTKKRALWALRLLGLGVLVYILAQLDYRHIWEVLKKLDPFYLLLYALSYYLFFLLKSFRYYYIIQKFGYKIRLWDVFGATVESQYLSFVTPGKLGDSVKIAFLNTKTAIPVSALSIAYVYDRFQDLYFLLLLGAFATLFFIHIEHQLYLFIALAFMGAIYLLKRPLMVFVAKKMKISSLQKLDIFADIILFFQNILIYLAFFAQYYFLAKALHMDIGFFYIASVATMGVLITLLPISIGGLGVREGVFIYLLTKAGFSKEQAFLLSFLDNAGFVIALILLLHLFYIIVERSSYAKKT